MAQKHDGFGLCLSHSVGVPEHDATNHQFKACFYMLLACWFRFDWLIAGSALGIGEHGMFHCLSGGQHRQW